MERQNLKFVLNILAITMVKFRFQDLEIWRQSIALTDCMLNLADELEERHQYKFAEQLRGATLSISNNIAEGSGSNSTRDFSRFLNMSRRSAFEVANMLFVLQLRGLVSKEIVDGRLLEVDILCRMITSMQRSLQSR